MSQAVFQQLREFSVDGSDLSDYDLDITVENPKKDPANFEVRVFNMPPGPYNAVTSGETPCAITLGWKDGPSSQVMAGQVDETNRSYDGTDVEYMFKGVDASEALLTNRISGTFEEADPGGIAGRLAAEVGLSPQVQNAGEQLVSYNVKDDQPVRHYLNQLLDYCEQITGQAWRWEAQEGKLFFQPDTSTPETIPKLSYDGLLVDASKKKKGEQDVERVGFTAMCDPRIKLGAQVKVSTEQITGNYEVESYTYLSDSKSGDHIVEGQLKVVSGPASADERSTDGYSPQA
jgi:hypothetical protein